MLYLGYNCNCLIVISLLISKVLNHPLINSYRVFPKDPFLALYFSFFILLLSEKFSFFILLLSEKFYPIHPQVIKSMLTILNSIFHFRLLTSHTISLTLNKLYLIYIIGSSSAYKILSSTRPVYLHSLVPLNRTSSTCSFLLQLLIRPSNLSHLQTANIQIFLSHISCLVELPNSWMLSVSVFIRRVNCSTIPLL